MQLSRRDRYVKAQAMVDKSFYRHYCQYEDSHNQCTLCLIELFRELSFPLWVHIPEGLIMVSARICQKCDNFVNQKINFEAMKKNPVDRLLDLNIGNYDRFIANYYSHYPSDEEDDFSKLCYGCKKHTNPGEYLCVNIPVDSSNDYTGGEIRVCQECDSELHKVTAEKMQLGIPYNCSVCKSKYTVTLEEDGDRYSSVPKDKKIRYMCPTCTHRHTFDLSYPYGEITDSRIRRKHCYCGTEMEVDSMLDIRYLREHYPLNIKDKKWEWCSKCFLGNHEPIRFYQSRFSGGSNVLFIYPPSSGQSFPYMCIQRQMIINGVTIKRKIIFSGISSWSGLLEVYKRVDDLIPY